MKNVLVIFVLSAFAKAYTAAAQSIHTSSPDQQHIYECQSKGHFISNVAKGATTASGNYDVTYVKLDVTIDPSVAAIAGTMTMNYYVVTDLNTLMLDLASNINVTAVSSNGAALAFTHNANDELLVNVATTQMTGQLHTLTVAYNGNPIASGFGSFAQTTHAGVPVVWTLSEPYGAKAWWPCKQDLNDKIDRVDVQITTPAGNTAVSNGILLSETSLPTGDKRFLWRHDYLIPAYLVAIAVTNYAKYTDVVGRGATTLNIDNYVYPENLASAQAQTAVTVPIMEFFESTFGDYPFRNEKYGHAQFGWGGGMEHTTISFMGNFSRGLIAHELAHQWFGNRVTCGSWQDIWLNESFATYLTGMTVEHLDGDASFKTWRLNTTSSATAATSGSVYVPAQDTLSVGRVFSSRLSYNKGAMVLHMLRNKLGDATFKTALQNYLTDPTFSFNYATTAAFQSFMEQQSGQNLTDFFNDWIYGEGYPTYDVQYHQVDANTVNIRVFQSQSHTSVTFFEGPLPLRLISATGAQMDVIVPVNYDGHATDIAVSMNVAQIEIDPDVQVLSKNNTATLSMASDDLEMALRLYPNPAKGQFSIQTDLKIDALSIFDLQGRLISAMYNLNTGTLIAAPATSGMYVVAIESDGRFYNQRLLVR